MSSRGADHGSGETLGRTVAAGLSVAMLSLATLTGFQVRLARRRYRGTPEVGPIDVTVVPPDPTLSDGRPIELLALGDSGMAGVGVSREVDALPVQIAARVAARTGRPVHVVGRARSGSRTRDVLQEQVATQRSRPDAIVLMVGTNDVTHLTPTRLLAVATDSLLSRLQELGAPIVMSSLPEFRAMSAVPAVLRAFLRGRAATVRQLHRRATRDRAGVVLVDVLGLIGEEFVRDTTKMSADRFHPSAAGYARIAEVLAPVVAASAVPDARTIDTGSSGRQPVGSTTR